jgi:cystathionine beta-lyase
VYPPLLRVPGNAQLVLDEAPLARSADGRYTIDLDAAAAAIGARTRMLLLCNPHNPVGRVFTRDERTGLAELCLRRGVTICADEIHCELAYEGHPHVPIASLDDEVADRTITLMAPSKTFNLPGLKCGLAIIPSASLRQRFTEAWADLVPSVNILGYTAALAAYRDGQAWLDALVSYLQSNRDLVVDFAERHLPGIAVQKPEATSLAWLDCRDAGAAASDPFTFFLERARVALNDGKLFGRGGAGFVRLNFGSPRALVIEGLTRMRDALVAS